MPAHPVDASLYHAHLLYHLLNPITFENCPTARVSARAFIMIPLTAHGTAFKSYPVEDD